VFFVLQLGLIRKRRRKEGRGNRETRTREERKNLSRCFPPLPESGFRSSVEEAPYLTIYEAATADKKFVNSSILVSFVIVVVVSSSSSQNFTPFMPLQPSSSRAFHAIAFSGSFSTTSRSERIRDRKRVGLVAKTERKA